jgi:hypothetical protein
MIAGDLVYLALTLFLAWGRFGSVHGLQRGSGAGPRKRCTSPLPGSRKHDTAKGVGGPTAPNY